MGTSRGESKVNVTASLVDEEGVLWWQVRAARSQPHMHRFIVVPVWAFDDLRRGARAAGEVGVLGALGQLGANNPQLTEFLSWEQAWRDSAVRVLRLTPATGLWGA